MYTDSFSPGVDKGLVFGRLHFNTAVFAPLYDEYLVLAARGAVDYLFGRPPLYELGQYGVLNPTDGPGGSWSVRGVPRQRYFGKQKAVINLELRSMVTRFNISTQRFGIGLQPEIQRSIVRPAHGGRAHPQAKAGFLQGVV